jgi:hypothetical protein
VFVAEGDDLSECGSELVPVVRAEGVESNSCGVEVLVDAGMEDLRL